MYILYNILKRYKYFNINIENKLYYCIFYNSNLLGNRLTKFPTELTTMKNLEYM